MSDPVDQLLADASVMLVVGPGGVGKTTLSAALGIRAARDHDRKVLVVTVDPARRLAQALGVTEIRQEEVLVPVGQGPGRFWALMVDMSHSWDQLVARHSPDAKTKEALLSNRLYRTLTQRFVQSHDFIALDHLVEFTDDGRYDLVIVDTPPSVHALDVLDAPSRMIEFFRSRFLKWLIAPYGNRLVHAAAKPFLSVAGRLLGGPFLSEITEFFWLFSRLQDTFVARAKTVQGRLHHPSTHYVVVETPEKIPRQRAKELSAELGRRHHQPSLRIVNRALPGSVGQIRSETIEAVANDELRAAVSALAKTANEQQAPVGAGQGDVPVTVVPIAAGPLETVGDLARLLDPPAANPG